MDTTFWRHPSSFTEWKLYPPEAIPAIRDSRARGALQLMLLALEWCNIYDTINYRLGSGLVAQKLVRGWQSLPVAPEHWKVEAKQLFETSLARIQIDARNIAQGTAASYPGLQKVEAVDPAICENTFIFISQGWQNVNVAGSISILVFYFVGVVLAIPMPIFENRLLIQYLPVFVTRTVPRFFTKTIPEFFSEIALKCRRSATKAVDWLREKSSDIWRDLKSRGRR